MSYRSKIVDIYQWRKILFHVVDNFIEDNFDLDEVERRKNWCESKSSNFVFFMVVDSLDRALAWRNCNNQVESMANDLFKLVLYTLHAKTGNKNNGVIGLEDIVVPKKLLDNFFITIDPITILIDELIIDTTSDNVWWHWDIEYFPKDSVVFKSMGDFRINLFNKKIADGEWSISD